MTNRALDAKLVLDFFATLTCLNLTHRSFPGYTSKSTSHHHRHSAWKQRQHHVCSRCHKDTTPRELHRHTHHYKAVELTKYKARVCKGWEVPAPFLWFPMFFFSPHLWTDPVPGSWMQTEQPASRVTTAYRRLVCTATVHLNVSWA